MPGRHSRVRCAACLAPLSALVMGACAQSGANNEHGPTFGAEGGADATQQDTGAPDEGTSETGAGDGGSDGGRDSASDTTENDVAAMPETGSDAPAEAATDAGGDAGFVAPTCDGVIGAGEYGGGTNDHASGTQVYYMTWDATNLYIAIDSATVAEANILYLAFNPGDGGAGTAGYPYDNTDVSRLPFAASLVVYAKQTYSEARVYAGAWGSANTTAVRICTTGATSTTREEVIPWSLVGMLPSSFGWTGYLAANPATNPLGYIYGQMPVDANPGGADAGGESFTRYYAVTLGVDTPFAREQ